MELQAHQIFVLVAGAFILGFFIVMGAKFKSASEQRATLEISQNLDTVITSAAQSPGSAVNITIPKKMRFACSPGCDCGFTIGSRTSSTKQALFGPSEYTSAKAFIFSQPWGLPRATNFLFASGPDYKYYIFHDGSPRAKNILRKLPKALRYQENRADYDGEARSVFVYLFTSRRSIPSEFDKDSVLEVEVRQSRAIYYRPTGNGQVFYSGSTAVWMAAMFSEDENVLRCHLRQGYARLEQVARVFEERTALLAAQAPVECVGYDEAKTDAGIITASARTLKQDERATDAISRLEQAQQRLQEVNNGLTDAGCPQVY